MATSAERQTGGSVRVTLWILLIVYIFNFIDRQIVNILAEPIRMELGLSDTQIGLMTGLAFALFYTVLGLPIARFSDRSTTNRPWLIGGALAIWSAMTALCGLAQNFAQLLLARIGVRVRLDAKPKTLHFPKIQNSTTDFYLLGWGSGTMDSHYHLDFLAMPNRAWNRTGLNDPTLFALIDGIAVETDLSKRDDMIDQAWHRLKDAMVYIPLHHQGLAWTMKETLDLPIQADNQPQFRLAHVRN